jgi:hypothetical protein
VAKKYSNFRKFGKLASLVKKIADENPDLKEQILKESKSKSKNNWNKIQKWTSSNLFQKFKTRPLKDFTKKNVQEALTEIKKGVKPSKCFSVFKIPNADLTPSKLFDLEAQLNRLDENVQIQIDISGGDGYVNTGIVKVKDLGTKSGDFNKDLRGLVKDDSANVEAEVIFLRLYKKGKEGDSANCSSYLKVVLGDDENQEIDNAGDRLIDIVVQTGSLTKKQLEQRDKRLTESDKKKKITRAKIRKLKTPSKVTSTKEDKKIQSKIKKAKGTKEEIALLKQKEKNAIRFEKQRAILKQEFKDGIWTAKEFKKEVQDLKNKILLKGGEI